MTLKLFYYVSRFSPKLTGLLIVIENAVLVSSFAIAFILPHLINGIQHQSVSPTIIYASVALAALTVVLLIARIITVSLINVRSEKLMNLNTKVHLREAPAVLSADLRRVANHLGRMSSVAAGFWSSIITCIAGVIYLVVFIGDRATVGAILAALFVNVVVFKPVFSISASAARGMRENRRHSVNEDVDGEEVSEVEQYYRHYFMRMVSSNAGSVAYYSFLGFGLLLYVLLSFVLETVPDVLHIIPILAISIFIAKLQSHAIGNFTKGAALTDAFLAIERAKLLTPQQLSLLWKKV